MLRTYFIIICLLALIGGRASAQTLPPTLRVDRALITEQVHLGPTAARRTFPFAAALKVDPSVLEHQASAPRQRFARQLLAAGLGFNLAAAVTPIYVVPNRSRCWSTQRMSGGPPLKGAAVVGAVGIGTTIGGGSWLGAEARRHGQQSSRRERLLALGVAALAFTLGQAALIPVFIADQICHS